MYGINQLTTGGLLPLIIWHYFATDGKNMVYVSNPNGLENNSKSSGWYNINEITPYLAKALYIEEY